MERRFTIKEYGYDSKEPRAPSPKPQASVTLTLVKRAFHPHRTTRMVLGGALCVLIMGPVEVHAEESGADALFNQGVRSLRSNQYDDAAALFRLSYEMEPRAATMCNLALTYERQRRYTQARDSYRRCASDDREGRYRGHALERAGELDRQIAARSRPTQPAPQQQVTYNPNQPPTQQPQPRRNRHILAWVGLGSSLLGLGSLGTAIGLHVWANNVHEELWDEYEDQIPAGSPAADRVERGRTGVNAAIALYAVGAVLTATGLLLAVLDAAGVGAHASLGSRYALRLTPNGMSLTF